MVLNALCKCDNCGGVVSYDTNSFCNNSRLLKPDGSLLAAACAPQEDNSAKIVAAIVANIWSTFEKGGDLEYQIVDCEVGSEHHAVNLFTLFQGGKTSNY